MKKLTFALLFGLSGLLSTTGASADSIQLATDLATDSRVSHQADKPIVFFVTADHCPYCELLRDEYFKFSANDERFLLREIELDNQHSVVGFNGNTSDHRKLAKRYGISLTPTVVFVGPNGDKLVDPMIGVLTMDYYHYYFEEALENSISALKGTSLVKAE